MKIGRSGGGFGRLALPVLATTIAACGGSPAAPPADEAAQKALQERLLRAEPGAVVELPEGTLRLGRTLTASRKHGLTLRGAGIGRTILDFSGQTAGAEGLKLSGDDLVVEDLSIRDTRGDGIKVEKCRGLTIRRVAVEWSRGPHADNGAYGLYPVQCQDVLIEDSRASGASDAGIYVGQSQRIVVRGNTAEGNVAGIEIENSRDAEVHDNVVTGNTGGILVFDLPDLEVRGGRRTRVFRNEVRANNEPNFAPAGNIVAKVPTGTGVMVMANDEVEIFDNTIEDHQTVNVAIVSYYITEEEIRDPGYDPYPEAIWVHGNRIARGGYDPAGGSALQSKKVILALRLALGTPLPDILWDGIVDAARWPGGRPPDGRGICLQDNGDVRFANLDAENDFANVTRDLAAHDCRVELAPPDADAMAS